MIEVDFNGEPQVVQSVEQLGQALDRFDQCDQFELWCSIPDGPAMCMLRNGANAWLMYLPSQGEAGLHSLGSPELQGLAVYRLSNGQMDEYPVSWSLPIEQCYKSIAYFFVNSGERPAWVQWHEA